MRLAHILTTSLALVLLSACGKPADSAAPTASTSATPNWRLASMPDAARPVGEVKKSAAEGEHVVIRARVGGRKSPITKDVGVFLVVDPSVPACDQIPDDNCPTPWDYCCEPKESMTANTATIQLLGADGKPLAIDLASQGLKPLQNVVIVGTVGPRPNDAVLVVNASGVHIVAD